MISRISRLLLLCIMGTTLCNAKDFEGELRNRARSLTGTNVVFDYIGWVTDQAQSAPVIKTRRSNNHWNLDIEFCTPIIKALEKVALTTSEKKRLVTMSDKLVDLYSNGPVDQQALIDLKAWQASIHQYVGDLRNEDLIDFLPAAHPHQPVIEIAPETQEALDKFQQSYLRLVKEIVKLDRTYVHRTKLVEQEVTQEKAKLDARIRRTQERLTRNLDAIGKVTIDTFKARLKAERKAMRHLAHQLPRLHPKIEAASKRAREKFMEKLTELRHDMLEELNIA